MNGEDSFCSNRRKCLSGTSFEQSPFQREHDHASGELSPPINVWNQTREVREGSWTQSRQIGLRADRSELRSQRCCWSNPADTHWEVGYLLLQGSPEENV